MVYDTNIIVTTEIVCSQWRSKGGGAMGAVRPGRHFLGAAKLRLYLKTKNREDLKKGRQKIWEGKKYFRALKKFFRGSNIL